MKFIVEQKEFSNALDIVANAVSSKPTHPILGNVLLIAKKGFLEIIGFDLSLGIKTKILAEVTEEGTITIPAKLLTEVVQKLSGALTVTVKPNKQDATIATIKHSAGKTNLNTLPADDYPSLPAVDGEGLNIPAGTLITGIQYTSFCASTDETKQILTGIHLAGSDKGIEFAATDGHKLATISIPHPEDKEGYYSDLTGLAATIPSKALKELNKVLATCGSADVVLLKFDDAQAVFEIGDIFLTTRIIEGNYPQYQMLIPKSFAGQLTIDRKAFLKTIDIVSTTANDKGFLQVNIDHEKLLITLATSQDGLGESDSAIAIETNVKESSEIGFNLKYLINGLQIINDKEITMLFNSPNQPIVFKPSNTDFTYLVMPVQVVKYELKPAEVVEVKA